MSKARKERAAFRFIDDDDDDDNTNDDTDDIIMVIIMMMMIMMIPMMMMQVELRESKRRYTDLEGNLKEDLMMARIR